jgi:hypothetical protein
MDKRYTITPQNVNALAARLTFLVHPRNIVAAAPVDFVPSQERCGITMRIYTPLTSFHIELENKQVYDFLETAQEANTSLGTILTTDIITMDGKDGLDPRVHKPEELQDE